MSKKLLRMMSGLTVCLLINFSNLIGNPKGNGQTTTQNSMVLPLELILRLQNESNDSVIKQSQGFLKESAISSDDRNKIQHILIQHFHLLFQYDEVDKLCIQTKTPVDDSQLQAICIADATLPLAQRRVLLENLFENVLDKQSGTAIPALVAIELLNLVWKENDLAIQSQTT